MRQNTKLAQNKELLYVEINSIADIGKAVYKDEKLMKELGVESERKYYSYEELVAKSGLYFNGEIKLTNFNNLLPYEFVINAGQENFIYVEGYCRRENHERSEIHSWIVEKVSGQILDNVEASQGDVYLGIPISLDFLLENEEKCHALGIIRSDKRNGKSYLKNGLPKKAVSKDKIPTTISFVEYHSLV